jgi:hypothetical protein
MDMRTVLLTASAALALAACQKSPGAAATGAAAPAGGTTVSADGVPHRRAGLWQQTISREGQQGGGVMSAMGGMKLCVDAASEAKSAVLGRVNDAGRLAGKHCSAPVVGRGLDGGYSFTSTCAMGEAGTVTSKGSASGDFATAYHVHVETDVSGAAYAAMNGHHVMDVDGKWLGPCPDGMAGGDIELANGMRINGGKFASAAAAMGGGR